MCRGRHRLLVAVCVATLGASCSDDGGTAGAEEEVTAAATDFALSIFEGDAATAWSLFSAECQDTVSQAELQTAFAQLTPAFEAQGIEASELRVGEVEIEDLTDSSATVTVEIVDATGELPAGMTPNAVAMVREPDGWKVADCEAG